MLKRLACIGVFSLCLIVGAITAVHAEPAQGGGKIAQIEIDGNQRIERATILSYMAIDEGDNFDDSRLNRSLKRLYASGLFADVSLHRRGDTLIIKLRENPIIHTVSFEGNKRIEDKDLEQEVRLAPRKVYTRAEVQQDVKRILDIYQRNGRFSATVEPKVIPLEQNRVNLVFEIEEGEVTKVKKVTFVGNKAFDGDKLRKVVRTEEERWYRFFSSDDTYDPDRLLYDQELLRRFYVSRGYADFQVTSATAELTPERDGFYVTFSVEEGPLYQFGDVTVDSKLPEVANSDLEGLVTTKQGETFNADEIEKSIDEMVQYLGDRGFAFVDVDPQVDRDPISRKIGLHYSVKEGPRVYVERINIHGNVRTLDKVIRREFRLSEGDPYSTSKLQRSEQRIRNLGFFEKVKINSRPGSAPDRSIIDVEVSERSTGELSFGAGFSTVDGALADVSLRENNLLGAGKMLRMNLTIAAERQEVDLGFTEPYFLDRDIAAGFDIFKISQDLRTESSYDRRTQGGTLRASYPLSEHLEHTLRYSLRQDEVSNVSTTASRYIQAQAGKYTTSLVGHVMMYDRRDNRFDPHEGYYIRFAQDIAGLGGDAQYLRNDLRGGYFIPVYNDNWIMSFIGRGGYIVGLGEDIRINDRFFVGGRILRGFNNAGIGPRDTTTTDALGGNMYYVGSAELTFPLAGADEYGFRGAIFTDFGSLWGAEESAIDVVDEHALRMAAGVGLAWSSPMGPIRLDYSHAFMKQDYDRTEAIRFSFGTRF